MNPPLTAPSPTSLHDLPFQPRDLVLCVYGRDPVWPGVVRPSHQARHRGRFVADRPVDSVPVLHYWVYFPDEDSGGWVQHDLIVHYHPNLAHIVLSHSSQIYRMDQRQALKLAADTYHIISTRLRIFQPPSSTPSLADRHTLISMLRCVDDFAQFRHPPSHQPSNISPVVSLHHQALLCATTLPECSPHHVPLTLPPPPNHPNAPCSRDTPDILAFPPPASHARKRKPNQSTMLSVRKRMFEALGFNVDTFQPIQNAFPSPPPKQNDAPLPSASPNTVLSDPPPGDPQSRNPISRILRRCQTQKPSSDQIPQNQPINRQVSNASSRYRMKSNRPVKKSRVRKKLNKLPVANHPVRNHPMPTKQAPKTALDPLPCIRSRSDPKLVQDRNPPLLQDIKPSHANLTTSENPTARPNNCCSPRLEDAHQTRHSIGQDRNQPLENLVVSGVRSPSNIVHPLGNSLPGIQAAPQRKDENGVAEKRDGDADIVEIVPDSENRNDIPRTGFNSLDIEDWNRIWTDYAKNLSTLSYSNTCYDDFPSEPRVPVQPPVRPEIELAQNEQGVIEKEDDCLDQEKVGREGVEAAVGEDCANSRDVLRTASTAPFRRLYVLEYDSNDEEDEVPLDQKSCEKDAICRPGVAEHS